MPNKLPFVAAAVICEKVLVEADGVASIVRIVDKHLLNPKPPLPEGIKQAIEVVGFFSVKSGDIKGRGRAILDAQKAGRI